MDEHYCSICGIELHIGEMAGYTEKPTCYKCANEVINVNSEDESVKVFYIYGLAFAVVYGGFFYLAKNVFIH